MFPIVRSAKPMKGRYRRCSHLPESGCSSRRSQEMVTVRSLAVIDSTPSTYAFSIGVPGRMKRSSITVTVCDGVLRISITVANHYHLGPPRSIAVNLDRSRGIDSVTAQLRHSRRQRAKWQASPAPPEAGVGMRIGIMRGPIRHLTLDRKGVLRNPWPSATPPELCGPEPLKRPTASCSRNPATRAA